MRRFDLHQENAEKNTTRLFYQMVAVQFVTIILSGLVIAGVLAFTIGIYMEVNGPEPIGENVSGSLLLKIGLESYAAAMLLVGSVIALGGYFKFEELKVGGSKIAENLCATPIDPETDKTREVRLRNIVQEMAVASGIVAPSIYVLKNEPGINAFAAGHTFDDAVIVVTEGALERLSRDQMQGIIAHEFAHILNGDMARNMKLVAFTYGNYCVCELAEHLINQSFIEDPHGYLVQIMAMLFGYLLFPLGLINASIACAFTASMNRQGEYLADATAVELARYPGGLSEALMMVAGNKGKGRILRSGCNAVNHLFLVDGVNSRYRCFDSHPELDERILRLRPDWDGYYLYETEDELGVYGEAWDDVVELAGLGKASSRRKDSFVEQIVPAVVAGAVGASSSISSTSTLTENEKLVAGEDGVPEWIAIHDEEVVQISPDLRQLAEHPEVAGLVLVALRMEQFGNDVAAQFQQQLNPVVAAGLNQVSPVIAALKDDQKFWMFDHALEVITQSPAIVKSLFADFAAKTTVALTEETDIACWAWQRVVDSKISPHEKRKARFDEMEQMTAEVMVVLSALTHADSGGEVTDQYTFMRSVMHTGLSNQVLIPADQSGVIEIDEALDRLAWMSARLRRKVVVACVAGTTANRSVSVEEAWLMRAICCSLNFPSPHLYPGQTLVAGL